jgi:hypothetical protein
VGGSTCADVDYEKVRSTLYGGSDQEVATLLQVRIGTEFQRKTVLYSSKRFRNSSADLCLIYKLLLWVADTLTVKRSRCTYVRR